MHEHSICSASYIERARCTAPAVLDTESEDGRLCGNALNARANFCLDVVLEAIVDQRDDVV
jgi:hypothetical protein